MRGTTVAIRLGLFLWCCLLPARVQSDTFTSEEVLRLPAGSGPNQVGIFPGAPDEAPYGPSCLAVAEAGQLAILDRVNGRLQFYDRGGRLKRTISIAVDAHDLAIGQDGAIILLDLAKRLVHQLDGAGSGLRTAAIPKRIPLVRGVALSPGGDVELISLLQRTYSLKNPEGPKRALLGFERSFQYYTRKVDTHRGEIWAIQGDRPADVKASRHVRVAQIQTKARLGSIRFLNTDRDGNFYILVETLSDTAPLSVRREVVKFSRLGAKLAVAALPPPGPVQIEKDIAVDRNGDVLVMVAERSGIRVLRYASGRDAR